MGRKSAVSWLGMFEDQTQSAGSRPPTGPGQDRENSKIGIRRCSGSPPKGNVEGYEDRPRGAGESWSPLPFSQFGQVNKMLIKWLAGRIHGRMVGMTIGYADRVFLCLEVHAARCVGGFSLASR